MNSIYITIICLLILALGAVNLCALEGLPPSNPYLLATSGLTGLTDSPANTIINPAAGDNGIAASTTYINGMQELRQSELSATLSYESAGMFAGWQTLGNDQYQRDDYRMGMRYKGRHFRVAAGLKLSYDDVPGENSAKANWAYAGYRFMLYNTTVDISADNLNVFDDVQCPTQKSFNFCLGQGIVNDGALALGISKLSQGDPVYKFGCRFTVYPGMQAMASWESEPGRFGMGTTYKVKHVEIAYAVQTHPDLDWTHAFGLSILLP